MLIMRALHSIENSRYFTDQGVSIDACQEGLTDVRDHFRVYFYAMAWLASKPKDKVLDLRLLVKRCVT